MSPNDKASLLKPLKWYKKLATKKGRLEAGAFLIEGERAISQVILTSPESVIEIITSEEPPLAHGNYPTRTVTASQLRSICHTETPQGTAAVIRLPADTYTDRLPEKPGDKILLLEDIQDPGNVGTLIRTATAFGFSGIILTEKCADPISPKCVQSTAGTVLSVWLRRTGRYLELAEKIKNKGFFLVSTDLNGNEDTSVLANREKLVLALGNEAAGLSETVLNISDYRLRVPFMRDRVESLNVAACGAICMYLGFRKK